MCLELYREYGTTMAGLKALFYEIDNNDLCSWKIAVRNTEARSGVKKPTTFDATEENSIICFETLNPPLQPPDKSPIVCKASMEAFEAAIQLANVDPKKTILFDDSARNIATICYTCLNRFSSGHEIFITWRER
ncbi:hypothetical protein F3Y22_tig00110333pilonHSYRG00051 [Hibiscus syriacus]|uniref:Uncharacterized protein n=1 Tax=Hibiscus syriacus TaxID=106335 RepID=A0A6A3AYY0_HIBSY|nr:hypothetical protein F3Y22_tig00110333pilonHSYRG00051 [Hibiscus syriacus]